MEYPYFKPVIDGQTLGAKTGLNILTARNQWLYGQSLFVYSMFKQKLITGVGSQVPIGDPSVCWIGTTTYRAEHPSLHISAYWSGGNTEAAWSTTMELQIWAEDPADSTFKWRVLDTETIDQDTTPNPRFFKNTQYNIYDLSTYTLQNSMIMLRFRRLDMTSSNTTGGDLQIYHAFMDGWVGLDAYVEPGVFDGEVLPVDDDFNELIAAQDFVYNKICHNDTPSYTQRLEHTQGGAYEILDKLAFTYRGWGELYLGIRINETSLAPGQSVEVKLKTFDCYNDSTGESLTGGSATFPPVTLTTITTVGTTLFTFDLALIGTGGYGAIPLTKFDTYRIDIGTTDGISVSVFEAYIRKKIADCRSTTLPLWTHKDKVEDTDLNLLVADIIEMADNDGDYRAAYTHPLVTWLCGDNVSYPSDATDHTGNLKTININPSYGIMHRLPWLRWVGKGTLESRTGIYAADGSWVPTYSVALQDVKELINPNLEGTIYDIDAYKVSVLQALDLNTIKWMAYGLEYNVRGVLVAYEDYAL
jgi:hypothetical protein